MPSHSGASNYPGEPLANAPHRLAVEGNARDQPEDTPTTVFRRSKRRWGDGLGLLAPNG